MSQSIRIDNYGSLNTVEKTQLDASCAASATTLTVKNNQGFVAGNTILIGRPGSESGERAIVNSTSGSNSIVLSSGISFSHERSVDVTKLFGDKIRIYRASNSDGTQPVDASFTLLATVDIDYDQLFTDYTDTSGGSDYWYKFVYYNTTLATSTDIADSSCSRGGVVGIYASIESIRQEAGLSNARYVSDSLVSQKRAAAQSMINATLTGIYVVPFTAPIDPLIEECTKVLAAGYLLLENYGALTVLNTNNGQAKVDSIIGTKDKPGLLDKIKNKNVTLVNAIGVAQATETSVQFSGWPNASTADADSSVGGGDFMFTVGDRY